MFLCEIIKLLQSAVVKAVSSAIFNSDPVYRYIYLIKDTESKKKNFFFKPFVKRKRKLYKKGIYFGQLVHC